MRPLGTLTVATLLGMRPLGTLTVATLLAVRPLGTLTAPTLLAVRWLGSAGAAAPASVFLDELTWTEFRDLAATKSLVVIVPVGGTEQNGPHMTLGKHNIRVRALSEK